MSSLTDLQDRTEMVYRVDKFVAPASAREELLGKVNMTHRLLHDQPGFVHDLILEDTSDNGSFRLVTLVAWRDADAMSQATRVVSADHGLNRDQHSRRDLRATTAAPSTTSASTPAETLSTA